MRRWYKTASGPSGAMRTVAARRLTAIARDWTTALVSGAPRDPASPGCARLSQPCTVPPLLLGMSRRHRPVLPGSPAHRVSLTNARARDDGDGDQVLDIASRSRVSTRGRSDPALARARVDDATPGRLGKAVRTARSVALAPGPPTASRRIAASARAGRMAASVASRRPEAVALLQ